MKVVWGPCHRVSSIEQQDTTQGTPGHPKLPLQGDLVPSAAAAKLGLEKDSFRN